MWHKTIYLLWKTSKHKLFKSGRERDRDKDSENDENDDEDDYDDEEEEEEYEEELGIAQLRQKCIK